MAGYQDIIGHDRIKEQLKNAIKYDKVGHAYIFNGPKDCGKRMLADAFARALQCESGNPAGCGICKSCHQAENHNQPDIIYFQPEEAGKPKIGEIREQIVNDIDIKPYSSRYKIYIVDDADLLREDSQNTLLKTIEEPPAYGIIILLTTNADSLLQTIRSRCIRINLQTVSDDLIRDYLMKNYRLPDYEANVTVAFAQGNVGRAIKLGNSSDFTEKKNYVLNLLRHIGSAETYRLSDYISELEPYKAELGEYFDLMTVWYRDILIYKATQKSDFLIYRDEISEIRKQAEQLTYLGIQKSLDAIEKAKNRMQYNGNFDLTIELLLLEIKETYKND